MRRCLLGVAALVALLLGVGVLAHQGKLPFISEQCLNAKPGGDCFLAVMWAKNTGMKNNPEWYPGLTKDSSFDEFQTVLWKKGESHCQKPCFDYSADAEDSDKDAPLL